MNDPFSVRDATANDISLIRDLAGRVWPQTYTAILVPAQINYMMELFYSSDSLKEQMLNGHRFVVAGWDQLPCGFADYSLVRKEDTIPTGSHAAGKDERWKLNKIYLDPSLQGKGLGKRLLTAVCSRIAGQGGKRLQLNVNRFNPARKFYEKQGFAIIREEDGDIGGGFFMNDYVMELVF